jgi:hypothetical protein
MSGCEVVQPVVLALASQPTSSSSASAHQRPTLLHPLPLRRRLAPPPGGTTRAAALSQSPRVRRRAAQGRRGDLEQELVGGRREGRRDRKRPRMESRHLLPPVERQGRASPVGEQDIPGDAAEKDARAACLPRMAACVLASALRARQRASWWPSTPHPAQGAGGGWPVARV